MGIDHKEELSFLQDLKISILGEPSIAQYVAFTFFVLLSMFLVKLVRYTIKRREMLKMDPPQYIKFDSNMWISDNGLDFLAALVSAFILFRFVPEGGHYVTAALNMQPLTEKMAYGVLLGGAFQYIWHRILNKVKI